MQSELYQRYNGFMLGFISELLRFDFAEQRYEPHRVRTKEVLAELGIEWSLPETHAAYLGDPKLREDLARELKLIAQPLVDFYTLGHTALHVMLAPQSAAAGGFWEIVEEYGLERDLLASRLEPDWHGGLEDEELIAEIVSRAYDLVSICLIDLPKQPGSCFVIMPFASPFREQYASFYRPALRLAGYEAIRAWEGVTNEHYLHMLIGLLDHCSAALADLSPIDAGAPPNLGVIHEIGMNMGAGNLTFMIRRDSPEPDLPSNFIGLPIATYDPTGEGWPTEQARELSEALVEINEGAGRSTALPD